jgi:aldehyde dehydrogenase (NAD+)
LESKNHNLYTGVRLAQQQFFKQLKSKSISFRIDCLKRLKKQIELQETQVIEALYADLGKPSFESFTSEILMVQKELDLFIKNLKRWAAPKRVSGSLINFPSQDYILSEAYGTILMISPWNYPFQLAMIPLVGAIAAGNTVVLKPSESAPHTSKVLIDILGQVFKEEWVKVIEGDAKVAQDLLTLQWDYIFFTGSTTVGKIVAQAAGDSPHSSNARTRREKPMCSRRLYLPSKISKAHRVWKVFKLWPNLYCSRLCAG